MFYAQEINVETKYAAAQFPIEVISSIVFSTSGWKGSGFRYDRPALDPADPQQR